MSSKHLDIESLPHSFNLKLRELENVFKVQCNLQEKKDAALEKEIENLKNILCENEKAFRIVENEKKKLFEELQECELKNLKLHEKLDERNQEILTLHEDLIEKTRESKIALDHQKNSERRIDNLKIELSGYLKKLSDTKKKLLDAENEATQFFGMYTRIKKMYDKVSKEFDFLKEDYENRNSIQEEFIQSLLFTLKKHGITEFEFEDGSAINEESKEETTKEKLEDIEEIEEEEDDKPPLKIYPWWRPSKSMTTIIEEDESCEADDEGDTKPVDSAIESDLPTPPMKNVELLKLPPPPPLPKFPQVTPSIYSVTVQKPAEIIITIESDDEIELPRKSIKVDIAIQNDLDAEQSLNGFVQSNGIPTVSNVCSNNSMISTPSDTSIINLTDDGKMTKKKSKTRSRKKKNSEKKNTQVDEKIKIKRRYSKVLTIGWY